MSGQFGERIPGRESRASGKDVPQGEPECVEVRSRRRGCAGSDEFRSDSVVLLRRDVGVDLKLGLQCRADSCVDQNCLSRLKQSNVSEKNFAMNDSGFVQSGQRFQ